MNIEKTKTPRFNTCYILGLLSYLAGCFTDPGGIPDAWWRVRHESPCDSHTMHGTGIFTYIWWIFYGKCRCINIPYCGCHGIVFWKENG